MGRPLTETQKKELAFLKANNEMLEKTKKECKLRHREEAANLVQGIQQIVEEQVKLTGHNVKDLENLSYNEVDPNQITKYTPKHEEIKPKSESNPIVTPKYENYTVDIDGIDDDIQYDILPLPSNGEPYKNKKGRLAVSFLTASDENIIVSPHLYQDGTILDVLLKRKIMDKEINPDLLCKGDRDAIILWLRATGYGIEFPITVKDPESGTEIETMVDLTTIKTKPFNLQGDEEGLFEYETKLKKNKIKFKFFNRIDEKTLQSMDKTNSLAIKHHKLSNIIKDLQDELITNDILPNNEKNKIVSAIESLEYWANTIPSSTTTPFNHSVTNGMELAIVEIDGNRDKEFIKKFINRMPASDAYGFRKYMSDNEPSMDFNITVERPASLGGGSFNTFLELDYTLFLNIS